MLEALQDKSIEVLREEYKDIVPANFPNSKLFMIRTIAYKLQERQHGKLKARYKKILEESTVKPKRQTTKYDLEQGQKITKEYKGKQYEIFVGEKTYLYNGEHFKSLSKVAKLITGKHLSGPLFFNLRKRKHA